jgi:hypothetical protein
MPLRFTTVPLPAEGSSPAARQGGGGKQATRPCNWPHPKRIGGGDMTGDGSGERRQQGRGGAPAGARFPARFGVGKINMRPWELEGVLGKG